MSLETEQIATETVVAPAVETPAATTTDIATETLTAPEAAAEAPQIDYNAWLAKESDGLFNSIDDFKSSLEKIKNPTIDRLETAPDHIKELYNWTINGGDPKEFYKQAATDYSAMPAEQAIKTKIKMDNPSWSDERVQLAFETQYKVDAIKEALENGDDLSKELKLAKLALEEDAKEAIQVLESKRPKFNGEYIHPELKARLDAEAANKEKFEKYQQRVTADIDGLTEIVANYELQGLDKDSKVPVSIKTVLTPQQKELAKNLMLNTSETLASMFTTPNGIDYAAMAQALLKATDKSIETAAISSAVAQYSKTVLSAMKNANPNTLAAPLSGGGRSEQVNATNQSIREAAKLYKK